MREAAANLGVFGGVASKLACKLILYTFFCC
jgi:hypothetical protein